MSTLTIRPALNADNDVVARLAQLDSQRPPTGEILIALRDDEPVAAISVEDGHVVADPFQRSLSIVELLRSAAARDDVLVSRPKRVHRHVRQLGIAA
jgi:hypothetical protein